MYCTNESCVVRKQMCGTGSCSATTHRCSSCGQKTGDACCPPDAQQVTSSCKIAGTFCQAADRHSPGGTCVACGAGRPASMRGSDLWRTGPAYMRGNSSMSRRFDEPQPVLGQCKQAKGTSNRPSARFSCFPADMSPLHVFTHPFPAPEVAVKPECSGWLSYLSCSFWSA